jgi:hypothetical protein
VGRAQAVRFGGKELELVRYFQWLTCNLEIKFLNIMFKYIDNFNCSDYTATPFFRLQAICRRWCRVRKGNALGIYGPKFTIVQQQATAVY